MNTDRAIKVAYLLREAAADISARSWELDMALRELRLADTPRKVDRASARVECAVTAAEGWI